MCVVLARQPRLTSAAVGAHGMTCQGRVPRATCVPSKPTFCTAAARAKVDPLSEAQTLSLLGIHLGHVLDQVDNAAG
eukprot:332892-Amphidinium_carterae.1